MPTVGQLVVTRVDRHREYPIDDDGTTEQLHRYQPFWIGEVVEVEETNELIAAAKGVRLPKDFLAAAMAGGLRQSALQQYLTLQVRSMKHPSLELPCFAPALSFRALNHSTACVKLHHDKSRAWARVLYQSQVQTSCPKL